MNIYLHNFGRLYVLLKIIALQNVSLIFSLKSYPIFVSKVRQSCVKMKSFVIKKPGREGEGEVCSKGQRLKKQKNKDGKLIFLSVFKVMMTTFQMVQKKMMKVGAIGTGWTGSIQ